MNIPANPNAYQDFAGQANASKLDAYRNRNYGTMTESQIDKVAKDFESMFVAQMLQPMFKELSDGGTFGGGHAEGIYRSMMTEEYGKMLAGRGELGISDMVKAELLKLQEEANK